MGKDCLSKTRNVSFYLVLLDMAPATSLKTSLYNLALYLFLSDHSSEVKLGNPLLVLLQAPFQLLSHLLFDRQVSPDRYAVWLSPIWESIHKSVDAYYVSPYPVTHDYLNCNCVIYSWFTIAVV